MTEYRYGPRHYHHYYHGKPKAEMPWRWIAGLAAVVLIPGAFAIATHGSAQELDNRTASLPRCSSGQVWYAPSLPGGHDFGSSWWDDTNQTHCRR